MSGTILTYTIWNRYQDHFVKKITIMEGFRFNTCKFVKLVLGFRFFFSFPEFSRMCL